MTASYAEQLKVAMQAFVPSSFFAPARPRQCLLDATAPDVDWNAHGLGRRTDTRDSLGTRLPSRPVVTHTLATRAIVHRIHQRIGARISPACSGLEATVPSDHAAEGRALLDRQWLARLCRRWNANRSAHTADNEAGLGCAGKNKTAPQVFLTTLWHVGLGLPWDFRVGPGTTSERTHASQMIEELPERSLLTADAGFVSYAFCRKLLMQGHAFLLRVGANVSLLTGLGYYWEERGGLVYLWPKKCRRDAPLVLRLIELVRGKQTVCLLTNILAAEQLSDKEAIEIYRLRWGEEVYHRSFKQTLERRTLLSRTPATCLAEVQWIVLGTWLLGLMQIVPGIRATLLRGSGRWPDRATWCVVQCATFPLGADALRVALPCNRRWPARFTTATPVIAANRLATTRGKKPKSRQDAQKSKRQNDTKSNSPNAFHRQQSRNGGRRSMAPDDFDLRAIAIACTVEIAILSALF